MTADRRRPVLIPVLLALIVLLSLALLYLLGERRSVERPASAPRFAPASFDDLPGWRDDDPRAALEAFLKSCQRRRALPESQPVEPLPLAGTAGDWRDVCDAARALAGGERETVRAFFEDRFRPMAILIDGEASGLFTGYYEPLIDAARQKGGRFQTPLYRRPPDLVTVDLGDFRPDLRGRRLAGLVEAGRLKPYASRQDIMAGALLGRDLEILWTDDPVALFFLQIQGSGRVRLPDGALLRIGYEAGNGHPYSSLGQIMAARGLVPRDEISGPRIRAWLKAHPGDAGALMAENASYVFFRILEGDGPVGAEGVALTPGRSLAIDRAHLPLGAPLWLDATYPDPESERQLPFRRLMIAQDSGSAITGAIRGDVFWGHGEDAETIAGRMANKGRLWLLLPNALADRLADRP